MTAEASALATLTLTLMETPEAEERLRSALVESGVDAGRFTRLVQLLERIAPLDAQQDLLRCSFCSRTQREVRFLVAGPRAHICDDCVEISRDIVQKAEERKLRVEAPAKPSEP